MVYFTVYNSCTGGYLILQNTENMRNIILPSECFSGPFSTLDADALSSIRQTIGGSKGGARDARPPSGSKFFHFHAVLGKILTK